ncbi:MAG: malto-oligosyltrehalose synthase [Proteobacteria bacterium]|nr:malto-oligosyltrehalose synthase [Pseudomonadota bacterium]
MRIPRATYRIQFNPSFGFKEAKDIAPYLAALGISDLYASPIFKARRGSAHGYDVVDPTQLNPGLGKVSDFEELSEEIRNLGMGWLQDVVPNHMAFDQENQMLMEVLEDGENSEYFHFFDIDWNHPSEGMKGRLLAPFLGRFYREALEEGEIKLTYDDTGFALSYYDLVFSLKIESYLRLLTQNLGILKKRLGGEHPDFVAFLGILDSLRTLPSGEAVLERFEQTKLVKATLWELYTQNKDIKRFIDATIRFFNGEKGNPESFNLLDDLISEQLFRLSFWKVATEEINYRRFFNINELISLRAEDKKVFDHTHALIHRLIHEGKITGLRIDHIDGLYDPTEYLTRIREEAEDSYIVVEKILDMEEELPSFWAIQGTTGYDFINHVNGILCKRENQKEFTRIYNKFTHFGTAYGELVSEKKRLIMGKHMAGDIDNLAHLLKFTTRADRHGSDITIYGLKRAMVEVMTQFPVYRTYISHQISRETDRLYIKKAVDKAVQSNPGLSKELRFIERVFLLGFGDYPPGEEKDRALSFVMRFQQFTGPLMAKGFEDTTLYVYNRLLSLNEVGGDPSKFGSSIGDFHRFSETRANRWPHSLNATATHDTKRGEDVRARMNVLSEIPREWERKISTWSQLNRKKVRKIGGISVPDRNDEYFLYQTLVGAFPFYESDYPRFVERVKAYIVKAVREAKVHTAWLKPDTEYEDAFISFVETILEPTENNSFLREFLPFQRKVSHYGIFNSLTQTLIKIASPGIPDFYQGTDLWDLNLVDPDNRRPVDFKRRAAVLREIQKQSKSDGLKLIRELLHTKEDGRIKFFLIYKALRGRQENPEVFQKGTYIPLEVAGEFSDHIVAFAREYEKNWAVTIAPRHLTGLIHEGENPLGDKIWADTCIPLPESAPHGWKNVITDQTIDADDKLAIGDVLKRFPVALLMSQEKR